MRVSSTSSGLSLWCELTLMFTHKTTFHSSLGNRYETTVQFTQMSISANVLNLTHNLIVLETSAVFCFLLAG